MEVITLRSLHADRLNKQYNYQRSSMLTNADLLISGPV